MATKTIKEFIPLEGETILTQIEGDAYNSNPNPIVQLMAGIIKIIWLITGVKMRTYIIATNLRIVQVEKKTILWGFLPGATSVLTLNKNSVQSVGYAMASSWFIFRKHYFLLANMSGILQITYKGKTEELHKSCSVIDELVTQR